MTTKTDDTRVPVARQVQGSLGEFALVLPPQLTPEMFTRLSIGLLRQNVKLAKAAESNPVGFLQALMECARLGLEPGTKEVALTPFWNGSAKRHDIVCIPQWQGIVKRMLNTGRVVAVHAEAVFSGDRFAFQPGDERPVHEVDWFAEDRGRLVGAYAYAVLDGGVTSKIAVIGPREAERAKAMSPGSNKPDSPWNTDTPEMWRKTAVRRLEDWVPSSAVDQSFLLRQQAAAAAGAATVPASQVVTVPTGPSIADRVAISLPVGGDVPVDTGGFVDEVTGEIHEEVSPPVTGGQTGTDPTVDHGPDDEPVDAEVVDDNGDGQSVLR